MRKGAPRRPLRLRQRRARGAGLVVCVWLMGLGPALGCSPDFDLSGLEGRNAQIEFSNAKQASGRHFDWAAPDATLVLHAGFTRLTDEYGHGVLGGIRDAKTLNIAISDQTGQRFACPKGETLPEFQVFEDIAPRLADMDGDGMPEIIVVRSSANKGAGLSIYDWRGKRIAATPYIGTRFRWLAPLGAADLDGDGFVEVAYVDRPHLAKTLRIWRYKDGTLEPVADQAGLTNHRIGEDFISGGIRDCGAGPEIVTADANWRRIIASTLKNGRIETRDIGAFRGHDSLDRAVACK